MALCKLVVRGGLHISESSTTSRTLVWNAERQKVAHTRSIDRQQYNLVFEIATEAEHLPLAVLLPEGYLSNKVVRP